MKPSIYGYMWSEYSPEVNFGDLLSLPILDALGYNYTPLAKAPPDAPVTFLIGTILDMDRVRLCKGRRVVVWGTGYRADSELLRCEQIDYRAVRGPVTRDILEVSRTAALGDPALVLPRFYACERPHGEAVCIPHWQKPGPAAEDVTALISPLCKKEEVLGIVQRIAGAAFVLTGSLHGAILAQAYGVPWALWAGRSEQGAAGKWADWAAYLGLGHLRPCASVREGEAWWEAVGQYGAVRDVDTLLNSFPHDIV